MVSLISFILSPIIVIIIYILFYSRYKNWDRLKKELFILLLILLLLVILPIFFNVMETKIAKKYYPTKECGHWGSALGVINKECECSGLKFSEGIIGYSKSICFGECKDCECSFVNATTMTKEIVVC